MKYKSIVRIFSIASVISLLFASNSFAGSQNTALDFASQLYSEASKISNPDKPYNWDLNYLLFTKSIPKGIKIYTSYPEFVFVNESNKNEYVLIVADPNNQSIASPKLIKSAIPQKYTKPVKNTKRYPSIYAFGRTFYDEMKPSDFYEYVLGAKDQGNNTLDSNPKLKPSEMKNVFMNNFSTRFNVGEQELVKTKFGFKFIFQKYPKVTMSLELINGRFVASKKGF